MPRTAWVLLLGCACVAPPAGAGAQGPRWTVGVGIGPTRIDDLAGTPVVPTASLERTIGGRGLFGARIGWIHNAGFYSLDAVTLDLGLGLRAASARTEVSIQAGPSAILGGDADGTPYLAVGPQAAVVGTAWLGRRMGLQAAGIGRVWPSTAEPTFKSALSIGLTLRL